MRFKKMLSYTISAFSLSMLVSLPTLAAEQTQDMGPANEETVAIQEEATPVSLEGTVEETSQENRDLSWEGYLAADVKTYLNVRVEPNGQAEKVGVLKRGAIAQIIESGEEWTFIKSGEVEGYVSNEYVVTGEEAKQLADQLSPKKATVVANSLNVRTEADETSAVNKVVKNGMELTVKDEILQEENTPAEDQEALPEAVDKTQDWVPVEISNGKVGYVSSEFVEVSQEFEEAKTLEQIAQEEKEAKETQEVSGISVLASSDELDLLAAIIQCEAGGESYDGKVAVGAVVMNRVNSPSFPNSISAVVYQSGQFSPVASGGLASVLASGARSDCYAAAQDVLNGANNVGGRLFFHAGRGNGLVIGNQTFY